MGMCAMYSFCKYHEPREMHQDGYEDDDEEVYWRSSGSSSDGGGFMVPAAGKQVKGASEASSSYQSKALWKRTIPKGRRCEPLDFSGLILYDEHGNCLQSTPTGSTRSSITQ